MTQKIFVVVLTYVVPIETIDAHRPEHLTFLERYHDKRIFLTWGPQVPRTGGIIMAACESKEKLESILLEDSFSIHGLATYAVYEFKPAKQSLSFSL